MALWSIEVEVKVAVCVGSMASVELWASLLAGRARVSDRVFAW